MKTQLIEEFGIDESVVDMVVTAEAELNEVFESRDKIAEFNQYKVLQGFQSKRINESHFYYNTGYGYDDRGREGLEDVYAHVFGCEAALVRPTIVNGTHALSLTLTGLLRPGDQLIYATGRPYDTLEETIGIRGENKGSLKDFGISYSQVELDSAGYIDLEGLRAMITPNTAMVSIQRATGYSFRRAISIEEIKKCVEFVKGINPEIICMVDNCYGEFLDRVEPTQVGVDVMAGSLIKNPGGGIALTGGYIAGKRELIEKISWRMTAPGIGGKCGLMFDQTRSLMQGFFMAPKVVNGAVKAAILCSKVFQTLGYEVCPGPEDYRSDIIQSVKLGNPEAVVEFCRGIQSSAPIDSFVIPEPWDMPGYEDPVIMAAGAFVQGSSIELSADAPMREPYAVYFQGGLSYEHGKMGVLKALDNLVKSGNHRD